MVIRPFQITLASTRPYSVLWRIGCMVCWRKSLWFLIQFKTCVKYHSGWKKDKTHIKPHKWMDMTYNNNYILIDRNQKSSDDQVSCCFSHHVKTNSRQFAVGSLSMGMLDPSPSSKIIFCNFELFWEMKNSQKLWCQEALPYERDK